MGYNTHAWGEITIDPPLTWAEIKDSPYIERRSDSWLTLEVEREIVETDEGQLERRFARAVVPSTDDELRVRDVTGPLDELLNLFGETHTFSGIIHAEGEENTDMWRLIVKDGRAHQIKAVISWPED